ncbi:hypothetical protein HPP92_025665 [Vanilla planifolia]|uniref:Uncharacterized protein n=1 Tax=Vanilla planifolia TaxID=51239 RepID=A0A835PIV4_VANPL|nr:hypothetical protein HPP92_025665 [Vanilla planifolia]
MEELATKYDMEEVILEPKEHSQLIIDSYKKQLEMTKMLPKLVNRTTVQIVREGVVPGGVPQKGLGEAKSGPQKVLQKAFSVHEKLKKVLVLQLLTNGCTPKRDIG